MGAVFMTDRGRVRQHNEDSGGVFYNGDGSRLAVVADGMGGHRAGDVASTMAIKQLQEYWEQSRQIGTPDEAQQWIMEQVSKINKQLYEHSNHHEECKGMGTTLVAVICTDTFCTIGHIGDSRCYILNENGFSQLTEDHSLVNELVRSGQISKEDAEHHPRKNILLRALGTAEQVAVDVKSIEIEKGDLLLLCSDGLSNKVSDEKLQEILLADSALNEKGERFIHLANELGGEDNITVIIVDFANESG